MRLQLEFSELTEVLRSYQEALESKARAEGQLWKEEQKNVDLEKQIRGLNARIDNVSRAMIPGTSEAMSPARINEMLIKVCGAMAANDKIQAIKYVREFALLGLKEAKDIVEGTAARAAGW